VWDAVEEFLWLQEVRWFALRTTPRHEKRVHERLLGRGVESFLPVWERWSRWKDRRKLVQLPLFSGYCFAHFAIQDRLDVITTVGVLGIVGSNRGPEPVEDEEIESLRRLIRSSLRFDPCPSIKVGMRVEVVRGPLMGVRGVLVRKDSKDRLVISVDLIRQGAAVTIDASDVAAI
jgi:transcription antitermination factor NusG